MSDFWQRVERRRKTLEMSRAEMARRAGISESTVSKALKKGSKPTGVIRRAVETVLDAEEQRA